MTTNIQGQRVLQGDGTWPFTAAIDGADLVVRGGFSTWFGGDSDPMDNGETASGIVTRHNPLVQGCALPMAGEGCKSTDGSPLPHMPYIATRVQVYCPETGRTIIVPVIDLGPAHNATTRPDQPHTIDLTIAAFEALGVSHTRGIVRVDYRVLGGAKFVHQ